MSEQIKVGEWVHHDPKDMDGVLLATHHEWAWVDYGGRFPLCELRENLTRIEPDVPQPKYHIGEMVRVRSTWQIGEIVGTEYPIRYRCRQRDGYHFSRYESELEARPEVCPTCGGKVGDAD